MNKAYDRINWVDYPETTTALSAHNLNRVDASLNEIDNRVISLDTYKANQSDLLESVSSVTYNEKTGVFVFRYHNGDTLTVDLNIEKIPVSFSMSEQGVITMKTADGHKYTANVASLIKRISVGSTSDIAIDVIYDSDGNKTFLPFIVDGSVTEDKLQPNFLADCRLAEAGSNSSALVSEGYALGSQHGVDVTDPDSPYYHNNAKYYSDKAGGSSLVGLTDVDITNPTNKQALVYDADTEKWVNGDVDLDSKADNISYDMLTNKLSLKSGNNVLSNATIKDYSPHYTLAPVFDINTYYRAGDFAIYDDNGRFPCWFLVKCLADCRGISPNDPEAIPYWKLTDVATELKNSGTVRYNSETDKLEILLNGEWIPVINVGAQWDGKIYSYGKIATDKIGTFNSSGYTYNALTISNGVLNTDNMYLQASGSNQGKIMGTSIPIDISGYTHLRLTYKTSGTGGMGVNIGNNKAIQNMTNYALTESTTPTVVDIDISNAISDNAYIAFTSVNASTRQLTIYEAQLISK